MATKLNEAALSLSLTSVCVFMCMGEREKERSTLATFVTPANIEKLFVLELLLLLLPALGLVVCFV